MFQQQPQKASVTPQTIRQAYLEVLNGSYEIFTQALEHPDPVYRYAAALAASKRQVLDLEVITVIHLVTDNDAYVQQAARKTLIILSKRLGQRRDFGPLPGSTTNQAFESSSLWSTWWSKQQLHGKQK